MEATNDSMIPSTESVSHCFPEAHRPHFAVLQCCRCKTYTSRIEDRVDLRGKSLRCSLCTHYICNARCTDTIYICSKICWSCGVYYPGSSTAPYWSNCEECGMKIDSSFSSLWEEDGKNDCQEVDIDKMEEMWRRGNARAKENWLGIKMCVDVGDPPRSCKEQLARDRFEEIYGKNLTDEAWGRLQEAQERQRQLDLEEQNEESDNQYWDSESE